MAITALTPQAVTDKWKSNAAGAEDLWANNLQATTKDIVELAIAQGGKAKTRYADAWDSGRLAAKLRKVGNSGIKQAAAAKKANYGVGIDEAAPRFNTFMTKLLPYIASGLPAIDSMPSGTRAQAKARQNAWLDYMADGKGQFA